MKTIPMERKECVSPVVKIYGLLYHLEKQDEFLTLLKYTQDTTIESSLLNSFIRLGSL